VFAIPSTTDGLARLFGDAAPWLRSARNLGMAGLERLPAAKRLLAQAALR
jgi:2-polyprenyl-6-methoxyphenol hydroxylase-like FAD-dependent oxidoreductase